MREYVRQDFETALEGGKYTITAARPGRYRIHSSFSPDGFSSDNFLGEFSDSFSVEDRSPGERCYFHITEGSRYSIAAPRALEVKGLQNLRDAGLYNTADGAFFVRPGMFYRSDKLARIEPEGMPFLQDLGLKFVLDFRDDGEARGFEDPALPGAEMCRIPAMRYSQDDAAGVRGPLVMSDFFAGGRRRFMQEREAISRCYTESPFFSPVYGEPVRRVIKGQYPLLYHCAAGKDRTGIETALLLLALGVPRETVVWDYMLSAELLNARLEGELSQHRELIPDEECLSIFTTMLSVRQESIERCLDGILSRYGSIEDYFLAELKVTPGELEEFQRICLIKH